MEKKNYGFRLVLENMKTMTWKERITYFLDYYKWFLLLGAFLIVLLVALIVDLANPDPEAMFRGAAVNVQISEEGMTYLTTDLYDMMGVTDPENQVVEVLQRQLPGEITNSEYYSSEVMAMVAMVSAGMLDYIVLDDVGFEQYHNGGMFNKLELMLTEDQIARFEGKIYTTTVDDEIYYAIIDITDTAFVRDCVTGSEKVYIGFPGNTEHADMTDEFFDWLLAWENNAQ